jgi:hypothetical protein
MGKYREIAESFVRMGNMITGENETIESISERMSNTKFNETLVHSGEVKGFMPQGKKIEGEKYGYLKDVFDEVFR